MQEFSPDGSRAIDEILGLLAVVVLIPIRFARTSVGFVRVWNTFQFRIYDGRRAIVSSLKVTLAQLG